MSSLRSLLVIAAALSRKRLGKHSCARRCQRRKRRRAVGPKWLNEWHDGLAAKGLNFGATYIADNIGNVSGGVSRGAIHLGRFDFSVDADFEKLFGWTGGYLRQHL